MKTITIDLEAYETLSRLKQRGQSFSDVIKQRLGKRHRASDLFATLASVAWSQPTGGAVVRQVKQRGKQQSRAAKL